MLDISLTSKSIDFAHATLAIPNGVSGHVSHATLADSLHESSYCHSHPLVINQQWKILKIVAEFPNLWKHLEHEHMFHLNITTWPILDTLQKMTNS